MTQIETQSLRIERTYDAPLARVRAALTEPKLLAKWFAPGPLTAEVHACDARVGGQYEISMVGKDPEGNDATHTATGTFTEVGPRRVAMTFNWSEQPLPNETTLAFDLEETKAGTRLVLTHSGFPNQEAATLHTEGWEGCLAKLPQAL